MIDAKEIKKAKPLLRYLGQNRVAVIGHNKPFKCPFHLDQRPSAVVYDNGDFEYFTCFGCNVKGDVFEIVGKFHNLDSRINFKEILKLLQDFENGL